MFSLHVFQSLIRDCIGAAVYSCVLLSVLTGCPLKLKASSTDPIVNFRGRPLDIIGALRVTRTVRFRVHAERV